MLIKILLTIPYLVAIAIVAYWGFLNIRDNWRALKLVRLGRNDELIYYRFTKKSWIPPIKQLDRPARKGHPHV